MDCVRDFTAHYKWEWFRRGKWRGLFREWKSHSSGAFIELMDERDMMAQPVLDCSCGLGLKTIVMREAGLNIQGADRCEPAVEYARLLAQEEGHGDMTYFVSSWAELPRTTEIHSPAGKVEIDWQERSALQSGMTCVSMGNPHVVFFCDDVGEIPLEEIGPIVENASIFPDRINLHVVQVSSPGEVVMRTWERGSGITLACGTGAAAVCVAGVLTGRTRRDVLVHLPGGDLRIEWREANNHVFMTGTATEVFEGEWLEVAS